MICPQETSVIDDSYSYLCITWLQGFRWPVVYWFPALQIVCFLFLIFFSLSFCHFLSVSSHRVAEWLCSKAKLYRPHYCKDPHSKFQGEMFVSIYDVSLLNLMYEWEISMTVCHCIIKIFILILNKLALTHFLLPCFGCKTHLNYWSYYVKSIGLT